MRWIAIGIIATTVLVGATIASASGSEGDQGGPPAFALVVGSTGTPQLIQGHTSGFTGVTVGAAGQGDYCLTPSPGVDVVHTAAVASEEAFYSNAVGIVTVRYQPNSPNCNGNQLEVKTFDQNVALTNQIAFTVNVP